MLISITTVERIQTLHMSNIIGMMEIQTTKALFLFDKPLKQSNPRKRIRSLVLEDYSLDKRLCAYSVLLEYIKQRVTLQDDTQQYCY